MMNRKRIASLLGLTTLAFAAIFLLATVATADDQPAAAMAKMKKGQAETCAPCPFTQCAVCNGKLGEGSEKRTVEYKGRKIPLCGGKCFEAFQADPEKFMKKRDAALIRAQTQFYPLDTCVVTGMKMGAMGPPVDILYKDRLVRFCCQGCVSKFKKNPAKYLAVLDKAVVAAQGPGYPLDTCPVTGEKLGKMGKSYDYVYDNVLVRFCCKGCVSSFNKNPGKYLPKVAAAWMKSGRALPGASKAAAVPGKGMKGMRGNMKDCDGGSCGGSCSGGSCGTGSTKAAGPSGGAKSGNQRMNGKGRSG